MSLWDEKIAAYDSEILMLWFVNLPLEVRYAVLAVVGLCAGAFANYLIYSWAYFPRHISPWAPPHQDAPQRLALDRIPVLGWLGLKRERELHGRWFWIRPILVELGVALMLPALYWFETQSGGLLPTADRVPVLIAGFSSWGHSLFAVHAVLLLLMVAATFIDFDEQTIPDIITLPGTLFFLFVSTLPCLTWLPATVYWGDQFGTVETTFNVPWPFEAKWAEGTGLFTALTIWTTWCFALTERHVVLRHGVYRALGYLCHGIRRNSNTKWLFGMWIIGVVATMTLWFFGGDAWRGLLTSLVGLAVGGGAVWAVRIVASYAMGQEAMGFGDVTLMAMIGAMVGWQCAFAAFFLAPIVAILVVLVQFAITRQPAVPFGPYLCAGTAIAVLGWDVVWNQTLSQYVLMGDVLLWVLGSALLAMGVMLAVWRQIKRLLFA